MFLSPCYAVLREMKNRLPAVGLKTLFTTFGTDCCQNCCQLPNPVPTPCQPPRFITKTSHRGRDRP